MAYRLDINKHEIGGNLGPNWGQQMICLQFMEWIHSRLHSAVFAIELQWTWRWRLKHLCQLHRFAPIELKSHRPSQTRSRWHPPDPPQPTPHPPQKPSINRNRFWFTGQILSSGFCWASEGRYQVAAGSLALASVSEGPAAGLCCGFSPRQTLASLWVTCFRQMSQMLLGPRGSHHRKREEVCVCACDCGGGGGVGLRKERCFSPALMCGADMLPFSLVGDFQ